MPVPPPLALAVSCLVVTAAIASGSWSPGERSNKLLLLFLLTTTINRRCAAHSNLLQYTGTTMPLDGVRGIYVVNLRRRADRLADFFSHNKLAASDVHVFEAVDGEEITSWSPTLEAMFSRPKNLMSRGEVACALSHLALWQHIATFASTAQPADDEDSLHLIMEDDARFASNAVRQWNTVYAPAVPPNASVVFLGGFLNIKDTLKPHTLPMWGPFRQFIREFTPGMMLPPPGGHDYLFSGLSYAITPKAARYLSHVAALATIQAPIDHYLLLLMAPPHLAFETARSLVALPPVKAGTVVGADSDVQGSGLIPRGPGTPDYFCTWKLNCVSSPISGAEQIAAANTSALPPIGQLTVIVHSLQQQEENAAAPSLGPAERSMRSLGLNYTVFSRVIAAKLDTERLRRLGFLEAHYQPRSLERLAMDLSYLALFDAVHAANKPYYLIIEHNQTFDLSHIDAVRSLAALGDGDYDVLFLDCPDACFFDSGALIAPASPLSVSLLCHAMPCQWCRS